MPTHEVNNDYAKLIGLTPADAKAASGLLSGAFNWSSTNEGYEYWQLVFAKLYELGNLETEEEGSNVE